MSFEHFGNKKNYSTVDVILNGNNIVTIGTNAGSGSYPKSFSKDITNDLNNGNNNLKIIGHIDDGNSTTTLYYTVNNIYITEPNTKIMPISNISVIITLILILITTLNFKNLFNKH